MSRCSQELPTGRVLCCQSTTGADTQQPGSADTSDGKLFTKWGSSPPNGESNLAPNHTELTAFEGLPPTPFHSTLKA